MKNSAERLTRYLSDKPEVQIGGIAANLARIRSFSKNSDHREIVRGLIDETELFIQHAAVPVDSVLASELSRLGERVHSWINQLTKVPGSPDDLSGVAEEAGEWSHRLLLRSGLLG
jgi:hypothetical protein